MITTTPTPTRESFTPEALQHPVARVVGDLTTAHLETAARPADGPYGEPPANAWTRTEGTIRIFNDGDRIEVSSPHLGEREADELALLYRRALRDSGLVRPETGRRYLVGRPAWYAALDRAEAKRLAEVAGRPHGPAEIRITEGVELVHRTGSWAYWSDGAVTTAIGLPQWSREIHNLSEAAAELISLCDGSDSGPPDVGWAALADVSTVVSRETCEQGPARGPYARERVERVEVKRSDGTRETWYALSAGYCEGYVYEIYDSWEELETAAPPLATE